jgi:hypothetical protein
MSKVESERIARIEERMNNILERLDDLKLSLGNMRKSYDRRYAAKWVEKVVTGVVGVVGTVVIVGLMSLLFIV